MILVRFYDGSASFRKSIGILVTSMATHAAIYEYFVEHYVNRALNNAGSIIIQGGKLIID